MLTKFLYLLKLSGLVNLMMEYRSDILQKKYNLGFG